MNAPTKTNEEHHFFERFQIYALLILLGIPCACSGQKSDNYLIEKGELTGSPQEITVSYCAIGCSCAQWVYLATGKEDCQEANRIYLEAADQVPGPTQDWNGKDPLKLKVTGQFYEHQGFPKGWDTMGGQTPKAKVFRYTVLTVVPARKK